MNILQVIPYFTPKRGGDVNVVYNLSKQLAERGHEVTIFTTDFEFDAEYAESLEGVRIVPFHCVANISGMLISPKMKRLLKKEIGQFDVIHLHNFRPYQNIIVHHYARKYDIPYVLQAHGDVPYANQKTILKKIFDRVFGYAILRDASELIALTETELEDYKKMSTNNEKITIIANGIDLSEYDNLPKRGVFRGKYSVGHEEKIILYLGRIHKTKGINLLVKAFSGISKELNNVRLVICGPDDGYQSALEELIKVLKVSDKVLFTGFVSNDEKKAAFVAANVFVTPTFYGFPVTFLEACACGTPIITTNKGDELTWIHDKVGYVVEYDEDHLRDAIFKILSNEGLRSRFGEEGKKIVRKDFGWNEIAGKIEQLYMNAITSVHK